METSSTKQAFRFLQGGGEMGALTRAYDWSQTPVGTPDTWPQSLRTTLSIILNSKFPMFLFWGPDLICFYNDAYRPSLGNAGKHPHALGRSGAEIWPEIWEYIKPLIDRVRSGGEATWSEDQLLPIYRNGQMEDVYWTFSYSPVIDESGSIAGVFVTCTETTGKVVNLAHLAESNDQLQFAIDATELGTWDLDPATGRFKANARLKDWFGLKPDDEIPLSLAVEVIASEDRKKVEDAIGVALKYESGGGYDIEYTIIHPATKEKKNVRAKGRAWFGEDRCAYRFNGTLQDITVQTKARERRLAAQQLADLAIKSSGIGLFRADLVSGEVQYSPAYALIMTGDAGKQETSRDAFSKYIHHDDEHIRMSAIKMALETGDFQYEPRVIWDDGSIHRVRITGACVFDESHKPIVLSGTVKDITEEQKAAQALREAEQRFSAAQRESDAMFRNVTNSAPTGLWLSDEQGGLTYLNRTLVEWTGMAYDDLLGAGWASAIIDEDRQRSAETFLSAVAESAHYDVLFRIRKGDGNVIWCRAAGDPYYREDGSYAGYAGFCMDIDEILRGRQAVEQSEARFRSLIEEAPVATCLFVGPGMIVEFANDIMLRYWGKTDAVIGLPLIDAVPALRDQPFIGLLRAVYESGESYEGKAIPATLEIDGAMETFYFDFTYKALLNAAGEVYAIINMAIDVTSSVLAHRKVEESQQQLLALFEESPVGIATLGSSDDLIFETANVFYGELVGRKPEDLVGKPLLQALPEIRDQGFDVLLKGVISSGEALMADEVSVDLMRNGTLETVHVNLTYQPRRGSDGSTTGVLVVATDVTQQVITRRQIEQSEGKLRGVIAAAPAGIGLFVGRDLIIENPNQTFIEIVGKGAGIEGLPLREAMPELLTEGQPFLKILDDVFTTGRPFVSPASLVKIVQGGVMNDNYYNISYTPVYDAHGEVYAILDIAIDVTAQVKAQQQLEESELFSRSIIDNSPVAIVVFTGEHMTIERVNENMLELLGRDESIIGRPFMEVMPELIPTKIMEQLRHVYTTGATFHQPEERIGLIRWGKPYTGYYNYIYKALQNTAGEIYGVITTATEVTEQVMVRQHLEEAEVSLRGAIELAELGTWSIDVATNGLRYSDRLTEWFGYDPAAKDYADVIPILSVADQERVAKAVARALQPGSDGLYDEIYTVIHPVTGQKRILHAQGKTVFDPAGKPVRMNGTARDVTMQREQEMALQNEVRQRTEELASANEELAATNEELAATNEELAATNEELAESNAQLTNSNEELAQYAYVASHDLQEPLRKILVFSGMLEKKAALSADSRPLVDKITQSAGRMSELIRDLLDFSRLLKSDALVRPVNLQETTAAVISDFELVISEKQAEVRIGEMPVIEAIALQMNQLFYNLLGNALKFTNRDAAPLIEIRSEAIGPAEVAKHISRPLPFAHYHHITVSDNGIGFEVKYAEQIFEVFKRLHGREMYPGSGIGLALCRRIVDNHQGKLYAESTPGLGTIFHLILPDRQQDYTSPLPKGYQWSNS